MDGAVLTFVLTKLNDMLVKEVRLISGVEDEIKSLRDDLTLLTTFLGGLDEKSTRSDLAQALVNQLIVVSYGAEDVVHTYFLRVAGIRKVGIGNKFKAPFRKLAMKRKLSLQAGKIKLTIRDIHDKKKTYGIPLNYANHQAGPGQQGGEEHLERRRRNVEEDDVVGFDQQSEEVIKMLVSEVGVESEQQLRVVSIIGMGGLGKSTLAKKIFNSDKIQVHFKARVWVIVSQHYEVKDLMKSILQSLNVGIQQDNENFLREELRKQMNRGRYLIVLDDVWTHELWNEMESCFTSGRKNGSGILLTTRIQSVANVASTISTMYYLDPLNEEESWLLFCKKALKGEDCAANLKEIGEGIVSKCKGLPLAIVVMGGFLSAAEITPSFKYWSKILEDTSWHPREDNDCSKILSLSYENLPRHLKPCFLYVGVFPEDFEIKAKQLCLLWVVEGFVEPKRGRLVEDEAKQYLDDLVDRNLLIVSKRRSDGGNKVCRIHDLLRDMCKVEALKFDLYKVDRGGTFANVEKGTRRLSLHGHPDIVDSEPHPPPKRLHTVLAFGDTHVPLLDLACREPTVMRILHIENHISGEVTSEFKLANFILLRYLRLHRDESPLYMLIKLPSICEICNLEVLDLKNGYNIDLPVGIWNLRLLRHISVRESATMPDSSSNHAMVYLHDLSCIRVEKHTSSLITRRKFPNLTKLSIRQLDNQSLRESLKSMNELHRLRVVKVWLGRYDGSWSFPATLTKISLEAHRMTLDNWELLGQLEKLQVLKLQIKVCPSLTCKAEAFPQLVYLKLIEVPLLALTVEAGALKCLHYLIIRACDNLSALPEQLWRSPIFRQAEVIHPSSDLKSYIDRLDDSKKSKVTIAQFSR